MRVPKCGRCIIAGAFKDNFAIPIVVVVLEKTSQDHIRAKSNENAVIIDALRDHTRDRIRALINFLKGMMNSSYPRAWK